MEHKILSKSIEEIKVTAADKKNRKEYKMIALTYIHNNENLGRKYENNEIYPGTSAFYKTNTITSIPVSQETNHSYKGIHLQHLSILEYVSIRVIPPIQTNNNQPHQRKNNTSYKFQNMHP